MACEKEDEETNDSSDNGTDQVSDKMFFKLDGVSHDFSNDLEIYDTDDGPMINAEKGDTTINIKFISDLELKVYIAEEIELSINDDSYTMWYDDMDTLNTINVEVTAYEEKNKLEGTFEGTVYDHYDTSDSLVITDGEFVLDISYY